MNKWLPETANVFYTIIHDLTEGKVQITDLSLLRQTQLYLLLSYAYYELDKPLLSDHIFDALCKNLLKEFDNLEYMLPWVDKSALASGTAYHLVGHFPATIMMITHQLTRTKK